MGEKPVAEVAVVGAGPAGISAALALAAAGLDVVLAAPPFDPGRNQADRRTTLLLPHSVDFLANLGVWPLCAMHSAPMLGLRIADSRRSVVTAPEILFSANELGLESFGANVPNPALEAALSRVADRAPRLRRIGAVAAAETGAHSVKLRLVDSGEVETSLAVAADGRNSLVRAAAGIGVKPWHYPQAAIAASFRHSRAHQGISTELHGRAGPLTTVPLPGDASSLVWVEEPDDAQRLATLPDAQFIAALEERLQGLLGTITDAGQRAVHPLSGLRADSMGEARVALVGEAAHVLPPIGAQGLNLSLRDAAALADCVADARDRGEDVGGPAMLAAYRSSRATDVLARSITIDLLNRSLLTEFLPVEAMRGLGALLLANVAPLRRLAMQAGLSGMGPLPRLMRRGSPNSTAGA